MFVASLQSPASDPLLSMQDAIVMTREGNIKSKFDVSPLVCNSDDAHQPSGAQP